MVIMMITRKIRSKFVPGGRKYAKTTFATNSKVIKGTPRMNSMKTTQINLMIGRFDCRPKASTMPRGNESETQMTPKIMLSIKPPIFREATSSNARTLVRLDVMNPATNQTTTPTTIPANRPPAKLDFTKLL